MLYFNENENKRFKKNAPSDAMLLSIINELKYVSKSLNEIARTANRFDFINARYCNRVILNFAWLSAME